jgi:DNA-binding phage protein
MHSKKTIEARQKLVKQVKEKSNQTELALKTGLKRESINRMFGGEHSPTLDNFILISDAAGFKVTLTEK